MSLSRAMMLVRSDLPLALNARKEVMLSLAVDDENIRDSCLYHVEAELQLLVAIFTLHPKSPSGWHHRRWCLSLRYLLQREKKKKGKEKTFINKDEWNRAASSLCTISSASRPSQNKDGPGIVCLSLDEVEVERSLCALVNERYAKNYYGWLHRLWLLRIIAMGRADEVLDATNKSRSTTNLLQAEVDEIHVWLQSHVSDHCAVNHQYHAVTALLDAQLREGMDILGAAVQVLDKHRQLLQSSAGHESLWYGRRSLIDVVMCFFLQAGLVEEEFTVNLSSAIAHKKLDLDGPCSPNEDIIAARIEDGSALSVLDVALHVVVHEIQLVRYCRQDTSAWDFQAQRVLAGRYAANLYTQLIRKFPSLSAPLQPLLLVASQSLCREDSFERLWGDFSCVNRQD